MSSLEQRREARRRAMVDAGIAILGSAGTVNVRAVCRSTSITERYFYEEFGTRDGFVRAVFLDVSTRARDVLVEAVRSTSNQQALPTAAVSAFVELMIDNPDLGRVLLLAPYREAALAEWGLGQMPGFFTLVAEALPAHVDEQTRNMSAVSMVGALTALFTEYLSGRMTVDREQLMRYCVELVESTPRRFV